MTSDPPTEQHKKNICSFTWADVKVLVYLIITAKGSPIIQDLIASIWENNTLSMLLLRVYREAKKHEWCELMAVESLLNNYKISSPANDDETEEANSILMDAWSAACEDYAWANNNLQSDLHHPGIVENSFYKKTVSEHICDSCGEPIYKGDEFYRRTIVYPAIRHRKCNNSIRWVYEYSHIDYIVRITNILQETLMKQGYALPCISDQLIKVLIKQGFEVRENSITALPHMGDFIMDYISGVDDFVLVRKYIPYLSYLICFLHMRGIPPEKIKKMGPDILFLRNDNGKNQDVKDILHSTGYVDIQCGNYGENAIDKEIKNMIVREIISYIFYKCRILDSETGLVLVKGEAKSYSVGEESINSDIRITVEEDGTVLCSDRDTCEDFCAFFGLNDPISSNMLRYMVSILR